MPVPVPLARQVLCEALGSVLARLPDTCLDVPYAPAHVAKLLVGCVQQARGTLRRRGRENATPSHPCALCIAPRLSTPRRLMATHTIALEFWASRAFATAFVQAPTQCTAVCHRALQHMGDVAVEDDTSARLRAAGVLRQWARMGLQPRPSLKLDDRQGREETRLLEEVRTGIPATAEQQRSR